MFKSHSDEETTRNSSDWSCGSSQDQDLCLTSFRQLLHPRELPDVESLSDVDLISLLNEIEFELLQNRIRVDFLDTLPARVAYKGILQLLDTPVELSSASQAIQHIDGCDSACESCFQLAHCRVAKDVLGGEWRVAVEQAGINPSWSAFIKE